MEENDKEETVTLSEDRLEHMLQDAKDKGAQEALEIATHLVPIARGRSEAAKAQWKQLAFLRYKQAQPFITR